MMKVVARERVEGGGVKSELVVAAGAAMTIGGLEMRCLLFPEKDW